MSQKKPLNVKAKIGKKKIESLQNQLKVTENATEMQIQALMVN